MRNPSNYTRGKLIGRQSRRVITFMFNPTTFGGSGGWKHGSHDIPRRSHPLYGGGSGNAETIQLVLHLDGDRGRISDRPRFDDRISVLTTPAPKNPQLPMDVMPEVNELRSMALPHDAAHDGAYGTPESFILSMGTIFNGEILVTDVSWVVTDMLPNLTALRADVTLSAVVLRHANQTNWVFLSREASNALTANPDLLEDADGAQSG